MKPLRFAASFILSCLSLAAFCTIPAGYYSSLKGKTDSELKTAAYNIVHNFTQVSSYSALPDYFRKTDVRPGTGLWWDMYSNIPLRASSFSGLNREHSFPKSWWGGSESVSAYVDLNHLYPSEQAANMAKSNYPLGVVDRSKEVQFDNGVTTVGIPVLGQGGGAARVFEPDDEYKGDFARTYFYMVTCYQNLSWKYLYMTTQGTYPTLNPWSIELLLKWHRQDPVSEKEVDRNEQVYAIQNNRNPFIDLPELAEYIWGAKKGQAFEPGEVVVPETGDPVLYAPIKDMEIQFGEVALGQSATTQMFVSGKFLSGYVEAFITGGDSKMFAIATTKIPASLVCSDNGYWIPVTYSPTELGNHSTKILVSGAFGSRFVTLTGTSLTPPVLTACTATAATDIQADRYTANWTAPASEVIDYFVVSRTKYIGGSVETEEVLAEENFAEITGFDLSDSEAYAVQSVRLGVRSPMSNTIFVDHTGISGVKVQEPLIVQAFDGFIRFLCSAPHTDVRIYDTAGRLIAAIATVGCNDEIALASGIYLITSSSHPTPIKAVVR